MRMYLLLIPLLVISSCRKHASVSDAGADAGAGTTDTSVVDASVADVAASSARSSHGRFSNLSVEQRSGTEVIDNRFDSTDDMSEPLWKPVARPLLKPTGKFGASQLGVDDKLSTSVGTAFELTYYIIAVRPAGDPDEVRFLDCAGKFLTFSSRTWRDEAIMEGTARFRTPAGESKSINVNNAEGSCWIELDWESRWGLGAWNPSTGNSFQLRPFRSIAIDRRVLVMGAWYYIKELDGVTMPYPASTTVHDGCVRAMDVGPAIIGKHIDFYAAYEASYKTLRDKPGTGLYNRDSITLFSGAAKCKLHIDRGY